MTHPAPHPLARELVLVLPRLRGLAWSITRDQQRVEDLVQDTVVRALGAADSFQPGTNLMAWLSTIMKRLAINEYRRGKVSVALASALEELRKSSGVASEGDPVFVLDAKRAFLALPSLMQKALWMTQAQGQRYDVTARKLGVPIGTVRSRVSRGREELQARLG